MMGTWSIFQTVILLCQYWFYPFFFNSKPICSNSMQHQCVWMIFFLDKCLICGLIICLIKNNFNLYITKNLNYIVFSNDFNIYIYILMLTVVNINSELVHFIMAMLIFLVSFWLSWHARFCVLCFCIERGWIMVRAGRKKKKIVLCILYLCGKRRKTCRDTLGVPKHNAQMGGEIILLGDAHSLFNSLCGELDVFPQCFVMTVWPLVFH